MSTGAFKNKPAPHVPRSGQIWYVRQPLLAGTADPHYALITSVSADGSKLWLNFITTSGDTETDDDLRIDQDESDFGTTGLKHTSHLRRTQYYELRSTSFVAEYRGY